MEHREALERVPYGLLDLTDITAAREIAASQVPSRRSPGDQNVSMRDHLAPSVVDGGPPVMVRIYRPADLVEPAPVLYYMHGGGMVMGSVGMGDTQCEELATSLGILVASVDYRLAPETPFPGAINDCYSGLMWLVDEAEALGVDRTRLAIGGRSAGAGLAASLALLARDRGEIEVAFQWLLAPMLDDRGDTWSARSVVYSKVWHHEANARAWSAVLGEAAGGKDVSPYAAAARATDLTRLPAAFIAVGELDLFLDEDVDYALRLSHAGVPVELHIYPGAFHGSDERVPEARSSRRMNEDSLAALRHALHR